MFTDLDKVAICQNCIHIRNKTFFYGLCSKLEREIDFEWWGFLPACECFEPIKEKEYEFINALTKLRNK